MLKHDGIPAPEELQDVLPSKERLEKGPVALIECFQDIPCDPCVKACPCKAITMQDGITDRPHLDAQKCTGCGLCVSCCPGLAIFILNQNHSKSHATLTLPHELLPVPKVGDIVKGLDRSGKEICEVKVLKVLSGKKFDKTYAVTIELPKAHSMNVRAIRAGKGKKS
jgi:Fe-S-cluster-containing hydrogenase component 2